MTNKAISRALKLAADLLEVSGGNAFRARAYASASRVVNRMEEPAASFDAQELTTLNGIGKGIAEEIREIVETGTHATTENLLQTLPPGLPEVLRVRGLGPKKVRALWQELDVTSLDALEAAAASGRLAELPGFGAKTVQNVLERVEQLKSYRGKSHYARVLPEALDTRDRLREAGDRAEIAGEVRRQSPVVSEVVFVTDAPDDAARDALADLGGVLPSGVPFEIVSAPSDAFGTTLWEATGSDAHLRQWRDAFGEPAPAGDERAIFEAAGVPFIPPALREGLGEIEWAQTGTLPTLVTVDDLRGTLHNHSTWSDGAETLEAMADAARQRGLEYYGIGDHSRSLKIAHGLTLDRLAEQVREAEALNEEAEARGDGFRILTGSECDILQDGTMDFPDDALAGLDVVVASVHIHLGMSRDEATARLLRAIENPHVDILGHATGRLLLRREGYPIDEEAVIAACAEHGTAIELNANPWRLDLDWRFLRAARDRGVTVSINPDAHTIDGLDDVRWGVAAAQKAGLAPEDVLNARSLHSLRGWLAARG